MAINLSALDEFSVSGLTQQTEVLGKPIEILLTDIIEDPHQPRQTFAEDPLNELAASIHEKGVKTPISVKPRNKEGKYVINHGARRYRASKIAGRTTIPAFIDSTHDDYDQAIENIQRENLTPLEIAAFIQKRIALGEKKGDIAKKLGKNNSFISEHVALITAPASIRNLNETGKCNDFKTLYTLIKLHEDFPQEVEAYLQKEEEITRTGLKNLSEKLKNASLPQEPPRKEREGVTNEQSMMEQKPHISSPIEPSKSLASHGDSAQKPVPGKKVIRVLHGKRIASLVKEGVVKICYQDTQEERVVELTSIRFVDVEPA